MIWNFAAARCLSDKVFVVRERPFAHRAHNKALVRTAHPTFYIIVLLGVPCAPVPKFEMRASFLISELPEQYEQKYTKHQSINNKRHHPHPVDQL